MATSYVTRPLLSEDDLSIIRPHLDSGEWSKSADNLIEYYPGFQTNSEMIPGPDRSAIAKVVMSRINKDQEFYDLTFPQQSSNVIVSRTEVGEGLKIHHDNTSVGEFSTTVFLSDPETYDGGELAIWYEGEVQKFKLPAGHAITYQTGAPHGVMPVTSGRRDAAVFWTRSSIKDPHKREFLSEMRRLRRLLPVCHSYDFEEVMSDPEFLLLEIENKFIRYFL